MKCLLVMGTMFSIQISCNPHKIPMTGIILSLILELGKLRSERLSYLSKKLTANTMVADPVWGLRCYDSRTYVLIVCSRLGDKLRGLFVSSEHRKLERDKTNEVGRVRPYNF